MEIIDECDLVDMMYDNEKLDSFKSLWEKDNDLKSGVIFCNLVIGR